MLAIGLGANLPSAVGQPLATMVAVRPQLELQLRRWAGGGCQLHWSPLFQTAPLGGPPGQPDYLNAAVVVETAVTPAAAPALALLEQLQQLELAFGRQRLEHWGPRSLDLDLLWWGPLNLDGLTLQLPHPRWHQRAFVLAPLQAIEQRCRQSLPMPAGFGPIPELLARTREPAPRVLTPAPNGWAV